MRNLWIWGILAGTTLFYAALDSLQAFQYTIQFVNAPVLVFIWALVDAFNAAPDSLEPFLRLFDIDKRGINATIFRSAFFFLHLWILSMPWRAWMKSRKQSHLVAGIVLLVVYFLLCGGLAFILGMALEGMVD